MIKIRFFGTGGGFDYKYGNSAAWIEYKGLKILLDCGYTVYPLLCQTGLINEFDYVLVTHLHEDHSGSLSMALAHQTYVRRPARKAKVLYPTLSFKEELLSFFSFTLNDPSRLIDFIPLSEIEGLGFVDTYGLHVSTMQTFAYYFQTEQEILVYSGDLADPKPLFKHIETLDTEGKKVRVFHDVCFKEGGVHTYYKDLFPYKNQYEIWAYHLDPKHEADDNPFPLVVNHPELLVSF